MVLYGGFTSSIGRKYLRQSDGLHFISGSLAQSNTGVQVGNLQNPAAFGTLAGVL
ncbi:hypothetical protein HMPREF9081_0731 [Centipeda periodontii DSM 2778]|uniref:Uncharacterized protein n=1 Tax=Centipeda periodontii DSM 2778 TaxID=888060 RepID=F5RKE6_9FIRM|nr:hypothetical protein HMPREF9081_0731 [Centipeda periodontii DSM 2778]